jgi:sporulation protein YabP
METTKEKKHSLQMKTRKRLECTGVISVEKFDRDRFELQTDCGGLQIQGQNLHIKTLNLEQGILIIEGYVSSMLYLDQNQTNKKTSWMRKIFQ